MVDLLFQVHVMAYSDLLKWPEMYSKSIGYIKICVEETFSYLPVTQQR